MKKFIIAITALLVYSPAFADWSKEDRSRFTELLWISEAENNADTKIRMVRFIKCITNYYEQQYSFAKVLEKWNSTDIDAQWLSEFIDVNSRCDEMIRSNEDSTNT